MRSVREDTSLVRWDFIEGIRSWRLWAYLGLTDIRQRYRRSMIGPIWLVLGLGVTVIGIGLLYSQILKTDPHEYVPFISVSLLIWTLLSSCLIEATSTFPAYKPVILSGKIPYTSFILRILTRNLIVAAHCIIVVIGAFVFYKHPVGLTALAAIPGVIVLTANLYWMMLGVALISARFRDAAQIIIYLVQIAFFMTPVIWQPTQLGPRAALRAANPFYHMIEVVRAPILNGNVPLSSFEFCSAMAVLGMSITVPLFWRYRRDVVYWI